MTTILKSPAMIAREKFARLLQLYQKQHDTHLYRDERFEQMRLCVEIARYFDAAVAGETKQTEVTADEKAALIG